MKIITMIFFIMTIMLSGCCSFPIDVSKIKPNHITTASKQIDGNLKNVQVYLKPFYREGQNYTNIENSLNFKDKNGKSLLDAWEEAVQETIKESNLFNNSGISEYEIIINITDIIHPNADFGGFPTTITAEYEIVKVGRAILGETIITEKVTSKSKSSSQSCVGMYRSASAYENTIKQNVELFMQAMIK